jgi:ubiquinone/menaquinone biosynthesis C-methylase UbiE
MSLRSLFRKFCYTANTIRYRVEWPRIEEAFQKAGAFDTLFDAGSGSGEFARRVLSAGLCKRVIALEYDKSNFATLQKNLGREKGTQLINGSLLEVPLPDGNVDAVLCTQVIEHITEHEKAAAEICRVLKPGGYAVITVPRPPEPFSTDDHKREGYLEEELSALFAPFGMEPIWEDWFLTRGTTDRMLKAWKFPLGGKMVPVSWVDRESHLTREQRRLGTPYGLLMLFRKRQ